MAYPVFFVGFPPKIIATQEGAVMRLGLFVLCTICLTVTGRSAIAVSQDDIAAAASDSANAQASVTAASNHMRDVENSLRTVFESQPDYLTAKKQMDAATIVRESRRQILLDQLHGSTEYQQAIDDRDAAKKAVVDARDTGSQSDIAIAAMDALKASTVVTKMDNDVLQNDPEYQTDNEQYLAAFAAMQTLNDKFNSSLETNSDWQRAKSDLDNANSGLSAALAKVDSLQAAWDDEHAPTRRGSVLANGHR